MSSYQHLNCTSVNLLQTERYLKSFLAKKVQTRADAKRLTDLMGKVGVH